MRESERDRLYRWAISQAAAQRRGLSRKDPEFWDLLHIECGFEALMKIAMDLPELPAVEHANDDPEGPAS